MSDAITADGMSFAHRTSAEGIEPKVFDEIGECVTIAPPNPTRESIDATHLKSPNKTREHKPTLIEPGECTIVVHYTPAVRLKADALFGLDVEEFQIVYPGESTETFFGFATGKATEGGEVGGKLTLNIPFKITGLPVFEEAE